ERERDERRDARASDAFTAACSCAGASPPARRSRGGRASATAPARRRIGIDWRIGADPVRADSHRAARLTGRQWQRWERLELRFGLIRLVLVGLRVLLVVLC